MFVWPDAVFRRRFFLLFFFIFTHDEMTDGVQVAFAQMEEGN